jgi:hypothetical protein
MKKADLIGMKRSVGVFDGSILSFSACLLTDKQTNSHGLKLTSETLYENMNT